MQALGISPAQASYLMIYVSLGGFIGRIGICRMRIGRRASGGLLGFGAAVMIVLTAYTHDVFLAYRLAVLAVDDHYLTSLPKVPLRL